MLWIGIILFVSRPLLATTELPVAFRAASYLDIFGWHSQHFRASAVENERGPLRHWDKANVGPDDQRRAFNTFMEVGKSAIFKHFEWRLGLGRPFWGCFLAMEVRFGDDFGGF